MTVKIKIFCVVLLLTVLSNVHLYAAPPKGVFVPTSAWLVGESVVIPKGQRRTVRYPCVLLNQFSNGYIIRFSGTSQKLLVMAIDFHSDIFVAGEYYKMQLKVSSGFTAEILGKAFNKSTFLINLDKYQNLRETLKDDQFMRLQFSSKTQDFSLAGIESGLNRLSACYSSQNIGDSFAVPQDQRGQLQE